MINSAIDTQNVKRSWSKVKTQNLSSQWPNCQCGNLTVSRDYRVHGSDPLLNVPCPHHFFANGGREPGNEVLDGEVENAEVRKPKYAETEVRKRNTEVRRKAA